MCGKMIGPRAVTVQEKPVAMRRRSLKKVFKAKAFADELMPVPVPANHINDLKIDSIFLKTYTKAYRTEWKSPKHM